MEHSAIQCKMSTVCRVMLLPNLTLGTISRKSSLSSSPSSLTISDSSPTSFRHQTEKSLFLGNASKIPNMASFAANKLSLKAIGRGFTWQPPLSLPYNVKSAVSERVIQIQAINPRLEYFSKLSPPSAVVVQGFWSGLIICLSLQGRQCSAMQGAGEAKGGCLDIFWVAIIMQGCQVCCRRTCSLDSGDPWSSASKAKVEFRRSSIKCVWQTGILCQADTGDPSVLHLMLYRRQLPSPE